MEPQDFSDAELSASSFASKDRKGQCDKEGKKQKNSKLCQLKREPDFQKETTKSKDCECVCHQLRSYRIRKNTNIASKAKPKGYPNVNLTPFKQK